jgi:Fe-S-cluster containining protein
MTFKSCSECGGRCCKGFGIDIQERKAIFTTGILLTEFKNTSVEDTRRYFDFHQSIIMLDNGERFIIDCETHVREADSPHGRYLYVESPCIMLNDRGRCMIYDDRPDMCKAFNEKTIQFYIVPDGCIYEPIKENK